jgi:uncharacterized protein YutE (UPF0331/DUF86 family)
MAGNTTQSSPIHPYALAVSTLMAAALKLVDDAIVEVQATYTEALTLARHGVGDTTLEKETGDAAKRLIAIRGLIQREVRSN